MYINFYNSPLGLLKLQTSEKGLKKIEYTSNAGKINSTAILDQAIEQLDEYFEGDRDAFDLPLDIKGTKFQVQVWKELTKIPFGKTISYAQLATRIGNPKAVRAVGNANGQNPLPIIIPCHRVIASDGSLGGYSGGLANKQFLLNLETRPLPTN